MRKPVLHFIYKTLLRIPDKWTNQHISRLKLFVGSTLLLASNPLQAQEQQTKGPEMKKDTIDIPVIPTDTIKEEEIEEFTACYMIVTSMPEFPGGNSALMKYISKHIKYPKELDLQGINGKVVVEFTVDKEGKTSDITVLRPLHPILDAVVVNIIQDMPRWKPAYQRGYPVNCKYTLPVVFRDQSAK